ncbi:hypothetical protein [Photobacterium satsumensis]|uniref:hypothetical protein n=1 Tax=Photobacterium satsumensis TaxID=2910239 RepID=UPI003D0ACADE
MRELNMNEIQQVNGGNALEGFNWGAAIGTVGGAVWTGSSIGATRGGIIGGAIGFSAGLGYEVGSLMYQYAFGR